MSRGRADLVGQFGDVTHVRLIEGLRDGPVGVEQRTVVLELAAYGTEKFRFEIHRVAGGRLGVVRVGGQIGVGLGLIEDRAELGALDLAEPGQHRVKRSLGDLLSEGGVSAFSLSVVLGSEGAISFAGCLAGDVAVV